MVPCKNCLVQPMCSQKCNEYNEFVIETQRKIMWKRSVFEKIDSTTGITCITLCLGGFVVSALTLIIDLIEYLTR